MKRFYPYFCAVLFGCYVIYNPFTFLFSTVTNAAVEDEADSDEITNDIEVIIVTDFREIVQKVRGIVRVFRQSPVRNDTALQPRVRESFGKELQLSIDVKTRWNSLLNMLKRFYELRKEIRLALAQLDMDFPFSSVEMALIKELIDALEPLEFALKSLSSRKIHLAEVDNICCFVKKKVEDLGTGVAGELKNSFVLRIQQRRVPTLFHLARYLKDSTYLENSSDAFGEVISRDQVFQMALTFLKRLFPERQPDTQQSPSTDGI